MTSTIAQWRRVPDRSNIQPDVNRANTYPTVILRPVAEAEADAQRPQAIQKTQCRVDTDGQPPQAVEETHCQDCAEPTEKADEQEDAKLQVVQITLRGHNLSLLLERTTDPDSIIKEAEHFDEAMSSWEKWGTFTTLTSMRGHFVVQYDRKDVTEAGVPRAVIGITKPIVSIDPETSDEEAEGTTVLVEPRVQLGTPEPETPGRKRTRDEVPDVVAAPPAKKACLGPSPDDTDSDEEDDDDDEPPDWSEYANGDAYTAENEAKEPGSRSKPDEILDTRVTFCYMEIIPPEKYEAMYMPEGPAQPPRSYLIHGKTVPEMGDGGSSDIVGRWTGRAGRR